MNVRVFAAVVLAALIGVVLPPGAPASDRESIYDTLALMTDNGILSVAVTEAKETAALKGEGPYTLFAPTDAAFKNLPAATIEKIATDKATVKRLLQAHLVKGKLMASDLKKRDDVLTLDGGTRKVETTKDGLHVGGAKIVVADIPCSNGVIHVIDAVLPVGK